MGKPEAIPRSVSIAPLSPRPSIQHADGGLRLDRVRARKPESYPSVEDWNRREKGDAVTYRRDEYPSGVDARPIGDDDHQRLPHSGSTGDRAKHADQDRQADQSQH